MIDLLSYFKNEPITIQGCFGYGLKEIVKQLYNHDLIKNQWQDDTDGLEAMVQFIKKSPLAENKNIPLIVAETSNSWATKRKLALPSASEQDTCVWL